MTNSVHASQCPVCGHELPVPVPEHCPKPFCGVALLPGPAPRVRTFRLVNHYSLLVLPFSFTAGEGVDPVRRLDETGRWRQRRFTLNDPADVDRTEYFLPYIRRFLFPSLFTSTSVTSGEPTCRHYEFEMSLFGGGKDGLPLTMKTRDARKKLAIEKSVRIEKIELIVFSYRIGFLLVRVANESGATYFDQMDVAAFLRTVVPLYRDFEMPELTGAAGRFSVPQLLSYLLAEFARTPMLPAGPETVGDKPQLPVTPAHDDRMLVYTFSCLDKETVLEDANLSQAHLRKVAVIGFENEEEKIVRRQVKEREPLAWLRTRWQGFSKDGGSLVVFNTDAYHERYAGVYHATYYFDIFLLAALQRVTLLTLFERLADIQTLTKRGAAGRKQLRQVRRDLLLFKNQCWFSQITNRERGLVLWKKWQKTLETRTLFKEVNEQSAELDSYLQGRHRERTERLMKVGGFLAAAVPAVWGLETVFGQAEWAKTLRWVLLGLLVTGSAAVGWYVFSRQDDL